MSDTTTVELPRDLHTKLRHWCVDEQVTIKEAVKRAVEEFLEKVTPHK